MLRRRNSSSMVRQKCLAKLSHYGLISMNAVSVLLSIALAGALAGPQPTNSTLPNQTTLPRSTLIKSSPVTVHISSTSPPLLSTSEQQQTTTTSLTSLLAWFRQYPQSAIEFYGSSYYVNYEIISGVLSVLALSCATDATCMAFDYDYSATTGYKHRITHDCATAVGAYFANGDSTGTSFFELLLVLAVASRKLRRNKLKTHFRLATRK